MILKHILEIKTAFVAIQSTQKSKGKNTTIERKKLFSQKKSCVKTQQQDETVRIWQYIAQIHISHLIAHEAAPSECFSAKF